MNYWEIILNVLTLIAIISSPFLAVFVNGLLDRRRDEKKRKYEIYRDLMATRAAGLSQKHVEALNKIEVEFSEDKENKTKKILTAWKEYHDHLNQAFNTPLENTDAHTNWLIKKEDYLVNLLYEMSVYFNKDFDKTQIRRGHYYPQGYINIETEQAIIRKGLVQVLTDQKAFPVLTIVPPTKESAQLKNEQQGKFGERKLSEEEKIKE